MTIEKLYEQEDFDLFIAEAEEKWLTFFPKEKMVEILFGSIENAQRLFELHKEDKDIWNHENSNFV